MMQTWTRVGALVVCVSAMPPAPSGAGQGSPAKPPQGAPQEQASLQDEASKPRVTGTVSYRERLALAPGAVVKVQLADVSRADAPAIVLGEQTIDVGKVPGPPFAFSIPYDPAKIDAAHTYTVQARIEVGGRLRFISDQRYAVITRGAPTKVDVVVKGVARPK